MINAQALKEFYLKSEKLFGNMKFAVVIISVFAIALVYGTFQESYHGAEYANQIVYKAWWFMLLQGLMFMSILVATIMRLPAKKSLYGFYTLHAGLLTLFIGSFVTYHVGIDGSLELLPNTPSKKIIINDYYLKMALVQDNKAVKFPLPSSYRTTKMQGNYQDMVKIKEYIPYATLETQWPASDQQDGLDHASRYIIFNENVSQEFTLALNPNSDFKSMQKLGPLTIHYMPENLAECFVQDSQSGFLVWNTLTGECSTAESLKLTTDKTDKGNRFLLIKYQNDYLKFFPDFSPMAVNDDLTKNEEVPFRVFSRNLFLDKPHLFLFGEQVAFYQERKKKWKGENFYEQKTIKLPWMNFTLRLLEHHKNKVPIQVPIYTKPIQDQGQIIAGDIKAVKIEVLGKDYWVRSDAPLALSNGQSEMRFTIGPKEITLPFQMTLKKFVMDKNPGTNTPASFESYIALFDGRLNSKSEDHHVYMNNPLKYDDFTFYQSSYFPVAEDIYGSVFSANYDPGRPLKYAGSALLVFGSIWHYFIRRRKQKQIQNQRSENA
jgi:hypothetical protein